MHPLKNEQNTALMIQDSSKLKDYMTCPRLYFFRYLLGWRGSEPNHDLIYGEAFHLAKAHLLEYGYTLPSIEEAMKKFNSCYRQSFDPITDMDKAPKNPQNTELALLQYCKQYRSDKFKVLKVEIGITVPISQNRVIHGRMDSICQEDNLTFSLETKTTGMKSAWWVDHWLNDFQVATYSHFLHCYFEGDVSITIDGTILRKGENEHIRVPIKLSPTYLQSWLIMTNQLYDALERDFEILSSDKEENQVMVSFPRRPTGCVRYNKLCPYFFFCHAWNNPLNRVDQLPAGMSVEFWNPHREHVREVIGGDK